MKRGIEGGCEGQRRENRVEDMRKAKEKSEVGMKVVTEQWTSGEEVEGGKVKWKRGGKS